MNTTLASQLYSNRMIADLLNTTINKRDSMTVEAWWIGCRVVIKRSTDSVIHLAAKGLSTIISWKKIFTFAFSESKKKSLDVSVVLLSDNNWQVSSRTSEGQVHRVAARPTGLSCSCLKYHTIKNQIKNNASLMGQFKSSEKWSNNGHSQPFCHHVIAVMAKYGAETLSEYIEKYKDIEKYKEQNTMLAWPEIDPEDDVVPLGGTIKQNNWAYHLRMEFLSHLRQVHCEIPVKDRTAKINGETVRINWVKSQIELELIIKKALMADSLFWINSRITTADIISEMLLNRH